MREMLGLICMMIGVGLLPIIVNMPTFIPELIGLLVTASSIIFIFLAIYFFLE